MENEIIGIYVEEDSWLLSPEYKHLLAKRLVSLRIKKKPLSRQSTTDWLSDVINQFCEDGGTIYDEDGDEIIIYDEIFDDAYFDDPSFSWNSDVRRFARKMPKRRSSDRLILRLQLFDAAFRIIGEPIDRA